MSRRQLIPVLDALILTLALGLGAALAASEQLQDEQLPQLQGCATDDECGCTDNCLD